ncbi:SDR family NAD(P)-dependent oxidoreductase [Streptomyces sp. AD16]|nr:SDR family NAD(P)-dependent oxidoreductase [Streptomyces sp. AD16]
MTSRAGTPLAGRTALVTGGGSGLGRAITRALLADGARVVITGRHADNLKRTAAELGPDVLPRSATSPAPPMSRRSPGPWPARRSRSWSTTRASRAPWRR